MKVKNHHHQTLLFHHSPINQIGVAEFYARHQTSDRTSSSGVVHLLYQRSSCSFEQTTFKGALNRFFFNKEVKSPHLPIPSQIWNQQVLRYPNLCFRIWSLHCLNIIVSIISIGSEWVFSRDGCDDVINPARQLCKHEMIPSSPYTVNMDNSGYALCKVEQRTNLSILVFYY